MHKKKINNSLTKNFIQGLRPLSSTLPPQIKKVLKKNGFNLSSIVDNWTNIVGNDISNKCYPINIKAQGNSKEITLILNVIHGKEIDVEYSKKDIIDKINSFFGYQFIKQIKTVLIDEKIIIKNKQNLIGNKYEKINNMINEIEDFKLKRKLADLANEFGKKKSK